MEENLNILFSVLNNEDADNEKLLNENVLYLAFVGDAIFDCISRNYIVKHYHDKLKIADIHKRNTKIVCASSQSKIIDYLIDNKLIDENDINIFKHGRNAHNSSRSKSSNIVDYRKATGFEVLLGYLFFDNKIDKMINLATKGIKYILDNNNEILTMQV